MARSVLLYSSISIQNIVQEYIDWRIIIINNSANRKCWYKAFILTRLWKLPWTQCGEIKWWINVWYSVQCAITIMTVTVGVYHAKRCITLYYQNKNSYLSEQIDRIFSDSNRNFPINISCNLDNLTWEC